MNINGASIALVFVMLAPMVMQAQVGSLLSGPAQTRPDLPNFDPPKFAPGAILPPVVSNDTSIKKLFSEIRVLIRDVRITGNNVVTVEELDRISAPYKGKHLAFSDLENLCDRITAFYIGRGYVSSGAVIPEQTIDDGVVEIKVVESKLAPIAAVTDRRLKQSYVRDRLRIDTNRVVNVNEIEKALQMLRQNPRIGKLDAELTPGETREESLLRVRVTEATAQNLLLRFDNYQAITLGSARGVADFTHQNVTGRGDSLSGTVRATHGLRAASTTYSIPLNARDTTLSLDADVSRSKIVEKPFSSLDIHSRLETYGFTLFHPARRWLQSELDLFITGELRRSQSFLLGSGFQFTDDLTEHGVARDTVLRLGQTWTHHGIEQALALRNSISIGIDAFGATSHPEGIADGQFIVWLGQFQWARRLPVGQGAQFILRTDAQLSTSPLMGLEKLALGGHSTVRGYRENELVRDNGLIGSLEARIPIISYHDASSSLQVAPFVDAGYAWNADRIRRERQTLPGAGIGLRWQLRNIFQSEIYWGHAFAETFRPEKRTLQDYGIHAGVIFRIR